MAKVVNAFLTIMVKHGRSIDLMLESCLKNDNMGNVPFTNDGIANLSETIGLCWDLEFTFKTIFLIVLFQTWNTRKEALWRFALCHNKQNT